MEREKVKGLKVERLKVERLQVERLKKERLKVGRPPALGCYTAGEIQPPRKLWAGWDEQLLQSTGPTCRPTWSWSDPPLGRAASKN
jgi:hypothetical protein